MHNLFFREVPEDDEDDNEDENTDDEEAEEAIFPFSQISSVRKIELFLPRVSPSVIQAHGCRAISIPCHSHPH